MEISFIQVDDDSFKPLGKLLEPGTKDITEVAEEGVFKFYVTFKENSQGWQIGYLIQTGKLVKKLECHPNTPEVFVPLKGEVLLLLAVDPGSDIFVCRLNRPVVLNIGVWHGVISLSAKSEIMIVENPDVFDRFYELDQSISDKTLIKTGILREI